ncbi:MAG: hypothetical protein ACJAXX_003164, partial [Roseivirga sp.]
MIELVDLKRNQPIPFYPTPTICSGNGSNEQKHTTQTHKSCT